MTEASIYAQMGVRTIINGRGATTAVGGSLMAPEVTAAMAEASQHYVDIEELNQAVGRRIAELSGAEAGYVTCGSCAAMAIAAAACIAGTDPERIRTLPESDGFPNEVIIHRSHRILYDQMYRLGGGRLVEIGAIGGTRRDELENALSDRTAAIAYHISAMCPPGALEFETVVDVARARGIPTIVDAASTLPPVAHLRQWIERGADLVIYSGGKGIRGPQDSGILAGRADLIAAARANGNPNASIGRGMKVSKEAMVGLWVALDRFMTTDHAAERARHLEEAHRLVGALGELPNSAVELETSWEDWPAPVVWVIPTDNAWSADSVSRELIEGEPSIHLDVDRGGLRITTHSLQPGDVDQIVARMKKIIGPR